MEKELTYTELRKLLENTKASGKNFKIKLIDEDKNVYYRDTAYNTACKIVDWTIDWFNGWAKVVQLDEPETDKNSSVHN